MSIGGIPYFGQNSPDWYKSSRSHPASKFGDAGPNPFLTPKDTPLKSFADVRKRIDDYDKKTIGDHFVATTAPWMARSVLTEIGDDYFHWDNNPFYKAVPEKIANYVDTQLSYKEIFNVGADRVYKPEGVSWLEFFKDKSNRAAFKEKVAENFSEFKFSPPKPSEYLERVVKQYNIGSIVDDLKEGRVLPALGRCLGIGTIVKDVLSKTKKEFQDSRTDGDSLFQTGWKTVKALTTESAKSITAWELGSIGFMFGSNLICVGIIPSIIAGCLVGGVFEAAFKSLFKSSDPDRLSSYRPSTPSGLPSSHLHSVQEPHWQVSLLA